MAEKYMRAGQEGARWVNMRPEGAEVAKWFESIPIHEGMDHKDYVSGVTLIPAKAKEDEIIGFRDDGAPLIQERHNLYFVPYVKVETRIAYFWRWMEHHPEWLGVIEAIGGGENGLPPGFFERRVEAIDGNPATFICCSMRARVYERDRIEHVKRIYQDGRVEEVIEGGATIIDAPAGTKAVNVLGRYGPDENALMKAETGAIGRALGMAGILVAPGSGVATAEDMQDAAVAEARSLTTGPEAASLPSDAPRSDPELREEARKIIKRLEDDHPDALEEFQRWARKRQLGSLNALVSPALKGVVTKLRDTLAAVEEKAQQAAPDTPLGGENAGEEPTESPTESPTAEPEGGEAKDE